MIKPKTSSPVVGFKKRESVTEASRSFLYEVELIFVIVRSVKGPIGLLIIYRITYLLRSRIYIPMMANLFYICMITLTTETKINSRPSVLNSINTITNKVFYNTFLAYPITEVRRLRNRF